jgi:NAD-dependent deacetylase
MKALLDEQLVKCLRTATRVTVLTGAGVSAESGVPTFRDAMNGLWSKFDPMELATPEAFARNPELVSRWYDERRCALANRLPNPGHVALAQLEHVLAKRGGTFSLVTQNVDRLHQAAGSTEVIELHGTLWVWRCMDCGTEAEERGPAFSSYPPRCPCGGLRRPGVVWFGEELPRLAIQHAQQAAGSCDLFMSLGTSSVVYPAAGLVDIARRAGARVLEVNPEETPVSGRADWSIRGTSGDVLPRLISAAITDARP